MSMATSKFFTNLVKTFVPKSNGNVVFAEDLNEATDEIEAIETILGTGLRTRTAVTWDTNLISSANLTARLNNMDAGLRTTNPSIHPQYALVDTTTLQPTTDAIALSVLARSGATSPVARFVGSDGSTVVLQVNNTGVALVSPSSTGTFVANGNSLVGVRINQDAGYTGNAFEIVRGGTRLAQITAGGDATFATLSVAGAITITDFSLAKHDHTSDAQGGPIFPVGTIFMFGGSNTSLPIGWLLCNGAAVSRTQYSSLFTVIGTLHGAGDGVTTFNLPNLVNRMPRGASGTSAGGTGGADTVTLTTTHLPAHTHTVNHDHGIFTSGGASTSSVTFNMTTGKETGDQLPGTTTNYITDGAGGGAGGTALTGSLAHTHSINPPSFVGSSGSAGTGSAVTVTNPYTALHFMIKA